VPAGEHWNDNARALNKEAELQLSTVERIVRNVTPEVELPLLPPSYSMGNDAEQNVRKALGAVIDRAEVDTFMTPDAPDLSADRLHPLVWTSARQHGTRDSTGCQWDRLRWPWLRTSRPAPSPS
jgi:hypothetical protein